MNDLLALLTDKRFMPHGHCYLWRPDLLWRRAHCESRSRMSCVFAMCRWPATTSH